MSSEKTNIKVDTFAFEDFETVVTAKRLESYKKILFKFFTEDVKAKFSAMPEHHTYFINTTVHRAVNAFDLKYLDPKIDENIFVTEDMDETQKEKARQAAAKVAQTKLFNMKKQLCIYILTDTNPYDKEKNVWGSMKKKFKIEPLNEAIKKEVRRIGRTLNTELKLYTYFPFNPRKLFDFMMRVDTQNLKVVNPRENDDRRHRKTAEDSEIVPLKTDYRDAAAKPKTKSSDVPKLVPVALPGTGAKKNQTHGLKGNTFEALDSDLDSSDDEITASTA